MTKISANTLAMLGISHRDLRVYRALLTDKDSSIRRIAGKAGINRGSTYESIKNLSRAGLVSHVTRGARNYYSAAEPAKLQQLLDDKLASLHAAQSDVSHIVDQLKSLQPGTPEATSTQFYDDYEGVAVVLRDVLSTVSRLPDKTYYAYSAKALRSHLYVNFPNFKQRRIALGIFVKVIAVGSGGDPLEMAERKWIQADPLHETASYSIIYGDKVATISLSDTLSPSAVVIDDAGVANLQRLIFERLWHTL
jgi:HTH-type transcriptional regulator, sugar sensing transcriptional regulator